MMQAPEQSCHVAHLGVVEWRVWLEGQGISNDNAWEVLLCIGDMNVCQDA